MAIFKEFKQEDVSEEKIVEALNKRFKQIEKYIVKEQNVHTNLLNEIKDIVSDINRKLDPMDKEIKANSAILKLVLNSITKYPSMLLSENSDKDDNEK